MKQTDKRCIRTIYVGLPVLLAVVVFMTALVLTACTGGAADQPVSNLDANQSPPATGTGTAIVGTITAANGSPLAEVSVMVSKGTTAMPEIARLTDDTGSYTWPVPAGTYTLLAHKDGFQDLSQDVVVKDGEQVVLDFQLKTAP